MEAILAEVASPEETEKVMLAYKNGEGKAALDKDMKTANRSRCIFNANNFYRWKEFNGRTMNDFTKMVEEAAASGK